MKLDLDGARLVRANEIELALVAGSWRVVGVDTGPRGGLRRLLPKVLGSHIATGEFLDWAGVEPFVGHVPTVRLRVPHPKLAKLHPAQIADLVEAASRSEGEEIIQAVGDDDRELEADVFEELDDHHQQEFLEDRPDEQVAQILSRSSNVGAVTIAKKLGAPDLLRRLAEQTNDLEPPAMALQPSIAAVLAVLRETPGCVLARMSGSGATCFGLFGTPDEALAAEKTLSIAQPKWWVKATAFGG